LNVWSTSPSLLWALCFGFCWSDSPVGWISGSSSLRSDLWKLLTFSVLNPPSDSCGEAVELTGESAKWQLIWSAHNVFKKSSHMF
jgi:hypothetical protein